jgi:DNA-binding transcriptional ArsR family regulator
MAKSALQKEIEHYVRETLHTSMRMSPLANARQLPVYLTADYQFFDVQLGGHHLVLMVRKDDASTPGEIGKHVAFVRSRLFATTVFVTESLTAKNRSRLIKDGIPFVVPGNQLYIPDLALDLREHFRAQKVKAGEALTPVAQAVLFHHLLGIRKREAIASDIAATLNYTPMSVGRAFDILTDLGLATSDKVGRERHIRFALTGTDLFERAKPMLRSPVRSLRYLTGKQRWEGFKLAGETALGRLTSLSPPAINHYATTLANWTLIKDEEEIEEVDPEEADTVLEIWSYDPVPLTDKWTVDALSLYAQFWDHPDERVAMAAEDLLGTLKW